MSQSASPTLHLLEGTPVERPWGGKGVPDLGLEVPADRTIGEWWLPTTDFPLLIKIIDARENLSIQLHPDDEVARRMNLPNGKSEAWYVLDCEPGARIFLGLREGQSPSEFLDAAEAGEDVSVRMNVLESTPGDVIFVPPGTMHAIGAGNVILEVQQISDTTFRVFDWNRKPRRELHLAQARESIRDDPRAGTAPASPAELSGNLALRRLFATDLFEIADLRIDGPGHVPLEVGRPEMWFCRSGSALIRNQSDMVELSVGQFCMLPPGPTRIGVEPVEAHRRSTIIRMYVP